MPALGRALEWSRWHQAVKGKKPARSITRTQPAQRPTSERGLLQYLSSCEVPVVYQLLTCTGRMPCPLRAKSGARWCSRSPPTISRTRPRWAASCSTSMVSCGRSGVPSHRLKRQAERTDGADRRCRRLADAPARSELFVGVHVDAQWGPVVAVGLGGVWVEVLKDTRLRTLPVDDDDVLAMLLELKGTALLDGFRGQPKVVGRRSRAPWSPSPKPRCVWVPLWRRWKSIRCSRLRRARKRSTPWPSGTTQPEGRAARAAGTEGSRRVSANSPSRRAIATASARLRAWSFVLMLRRWVRTILFDSSSFSAMALFECLPQGV